MGYTTEFWGAVSVEPPLNEQEIEFLNKFQSTRRMDRRNGPYFVDGTGEFGQGHDPDIMDFNSPPPGQPGLWCQWIPTLDGKTIEWDGNEKFYEADRWMKYLIEHFIGDKPIAKAQLPFLQGHVLNGIISAQGESREDRWDLVVTNNEVRCEYFEKVVTETRIRSRTV